MANMSNAFGVCIMSGEKEQLETIYSFMEKLQGVDYSTDVFECDILDCSSILTEDYVRTIIECELPKECIRKLDVDSLLKRTMSDRCILVSGFQGFGRWAYSTNIEYFLEWLRKRLTEDELLLLNSLDGVGLTFVYVDEEGGNGALACGQYTIRLELEDDNLVQRKVESVIDKYEYNADNLMKLDIFGTCYDLTPGSVADLLINATTEELEYLGLEGLVSEYTVRNVDVTDLMEQDFNSIITSVVDLEHYVDMEVLQQRLKELKEDEENSKV